MAGLQWTSYTSNDSINASSVTDRMTLYANMTSFFNSSPSMIRSGTTTSLQTSINGQANPSFTTFTYGGSTTYTAIAFTGFFVPDQTGDWTFDTVVGGLSFDDVGYVFIGTPGSSITPETTFLDVSSTPSSTVPVIYNSYRGDGNSTATVTLTSGVWYPISIYYNQTGYGYAMGLSFSFQGGSAMTDFTGYMYPSMSCFKEGTKILTDKGYRCIEELRKGDRVMTVRHDVQPIEMIGKREIYHPASEERIKDQLYQCDSSRFPAMTEDLVLTGGHSILVKDFINDAQRTKAIHVNGDLFVTDHHYRLPACADDRAIVYHTEGTYTVYHLALKHEDARMNYGIYANGLLVESCSIRHMNSLANMELIE